MPMGLPTQIPNAVIEAAHHNNVADRIVGRFTSTGERDGAIPTPVVGMVITVGGRVQVYETGGWKPFAPVQYWTANGIAGTSGGSFGNIQSQAIPAQVVAGTLFAWSFLRIDMGTMATDYTLNLQDGATVLTTRRVMASFEASRVIHVDLFATRALPAATAAALNLSGSGTANVQTYGGPVTNRLDVQFVPTPYMI